jgi:hypothetical protein
MIAVAVRKTPFTIGRLRPSRIPMLISIGSLFGAGKLISEIAPQDFARALTAFAHIGQRRFSLLASHSAL